MCLRKWHIHRFFYLLSKENALLFRLIHRWHIRLCLLTELKLLLIQCHHLTDISGWLLLFFIHTLSLFVFIFNLFSYLLILLMCLWLLVYSTWNDIEGLCLLIHLSIVTLFNLIALCNFITLNHIIALCIIIF